MVGQCSLRHCAAFSTACGGLASFYSIITYIVYLLFQKTSPEIRNILLFALFGLFLYDVSNRHNNKYIATDSILTDDEKKSVKRNSKFNNRCVNILLLIIICYFVYNNFTKINVQSGGSMKLVNFIVE